MRLGRLVSRIGGTAAATLGISQVARRVFTPHYPDVALHAGMVMLATRGKVLAIAPHPGDLELFAAGTLFLLGRNGSEVTVAVLSDGERGGNRKNMAEIRRREQEAAAAVLGYHRLAFLGLPDGRLDSRAAADQVQRLWEQTKPDVLLAFDPKGPLPVLQNPDHAALGWAVLDLARRGLPAQRRVYLYGTRQPNVLVDITEVEQEKEAAMRCHRSQLIGPDGLVKRFTRRLGRLARGRTPALYTEAFHRLV